MPTRQLSRQLAAVLAVFSLLAVAAAESPAGTTRRAPSRSGAAPPRRPAPQKAPASAKAKATQPAPVAAEKVGGSTANSARQAMGEDAELLLQAYRLRDQALNERLSGDLSAAVKHLLEATQLSHRHYGKAPADALIYMELADAAESDGQNEVARQAVLEWIARSPRSGPAHLRLAELLARLGQTAEAVDASRKAVELDPSCPRARLVLSLLLERQGQTAEAQAQRETSRALLDRRPPRPAGDDAAPSGGVSKDETQPYEEIEIPEIVP